MCSVLFGVILFMLCENSKSFEQLKIIIRECLLYFYANRDCSEFSVNVKGFLRFSVTRKWAKYFYVNAIWKGV